MCTYLVFNVSREYINVKLLYQNKFFFCLNSWLTILLTLSMYRQAIFKAPLIPAISMLSEYNMHHHLIHFKQETNDKI